MTGLLMLRLTLKTKLQVPLEAPCVAPDQLAMLTLPAIEKLPVQHGNVVACLADYFSVSGDPADAKVEMEGDCSRVKWLGAKMGGGSLHIHDSTGMHTGSAMGGGAITIGGDADDWLGAEMRGGLIRVHGRAGHHVGAAYPGSRAGMRGGTLLVDGITGDGAAAVMRRGLIAVGGCGDYAGASMVAGSLFVFGPLGRYTGMAMKRGTVAAFGTSVRLLPTFRESGVFEPAFLPIYLRKLRSLDFPVPNVLRPLRRYCGDFAELGLGEILLPVGTPTN
jgi:formylmethanofuran dehydrogenase subunit C